MCRCLSQEAACAVIATDPYSHVVYHRNFQVRELNDVLRGQIALRVAAYLRWVELRQSRMPGPPERAEWIKGLLEAEELPTTGDQFHLIEAVALTLNVEGVEKFGNDTGYFSLLDQSYSRHRRGEK